jgi:hypothetical protein
MLYVDDIFLMYGENFVRSGIALFSLEREE